MFNLLALLVSSLAPLVSLTVPLFSDVGGVCSDWLAPVVQQYGVLQNQRELCADISDDIFDRLENRKG